MIIVNMEVAITKTKINLVIILRIIIIMTSRSNITEKSEVSVALAEEEVLAVIVLIEAVEEEEQVATTIITTEVATIKKIKDIAVEEAGLIKGLIMKRKM